MLRIDAEGDQAYARRAMQCALEHRHLGTHHRTLTRAAREDEIGNPNTTRERRAAKRLPMVIREVKVRQRSIIGKGERGARRVRHVQHRPDDPERCRENDSAIDEALGGTVRHVSEALDHTVTTRAAPVNRGSTNETAVGRLDGIASTRPGSPPPRTPG